MRWKLNLGFAISTAVMVYGGITNQTMIGVGFIGLCLTLGISAYKNTGRKALKDNGW